jgi:FtsH-binding integral membrane protein
MSYAMDHAIAARSGENARATFIRRTYGHLAGAILAFVALEFVFMTLLRGMSEEFLRALGTQPFMWLIVLGAFMGVSWLAEAWARSDVSRGMQYAGLALYVVAEAVIFIPLMYIAWHLCGDKNILPTAGVLTLCIAGGLTMAVFITRKDFSFLGPILCIAGWVALGLILAGCIFGFSLGLVVSFAMVAFASAAILYQTSNVLHHYRTDQYVAAALGLFAAVALLFWYILQILLSLSGRD